MTAMTIQNYTGTADAYTFTYNPNVADYQLDTNAEMTPIPFTDRSIVVSGVGGMSPKLIVLTGHTSGTNMWSDYRGLAKHIAQTHLLKKLTFESDKYLICIGKQVKETHSGGRTMFIDYVATLQCPVSTLFSTTAKTSGTNGGNATTYILSITGTVTTGGNDVTVTDGTNSFKVGTAAGNTGDAFVYTFIQMADSGRGIWVSEYRYVTVDGTRTRSISTTGGTGLPVLTAGANVTTIVTANLTNPVVTFSDGYYM